MRLQIKLWILRYGIAILVLYATTAIYQHFFGTPHAQSLSTYFFNQQRSQIECISIRKEATMYEPSKYTPPEYDPPKSSFGWFLSAHPEIEILGCIILIPILFIGLIFFGKLWNEVYVINRAKAEQQAYYDISSISEAAKSYHQKYGEWPDNVETLEIGEKIGQSYDAPLLPSHVEKDPWGNEYKISHTDSQILVYSTAGVTGLELDATNPPINTYDTVAVFKLSTLSD